MTLLECYTVPCQIVSDANGKRMEMSLPSGEIWKVEISDQEFLEFKEAIRR